MMADFHFIRPWWFLALIPLALLAWAIHRTQDVKIPWRGLIAPHLLPFLLSNQSRAKRFSPLTLIALVWAVGVLAIAGPSWKREAAPFADDTSPLAIVIKVTPSMLTEDVQPSRLSRGVQKVHDLMTLRQGAKTALIAYAGTAHRVMPPTTDGEMINTFAQALDPKIMPGDGDAAADALRLAAATLDGGGSIVWIADSIAPEQTSDIARWRKDSRIPVRLLAPLFPGPELQALETGAQSAGAKVQHLSADDSDVAALARDARFTAAANEQGNRWQESGYWLTPVLATALLPFFRKGWMATTAARG